MRVLVFVLLLLAAAKVGTQQYLVSATKDEIIIAAYRERAVAACRDVARTTRLELAASWAPPEDIRVVIGKGTLDVAIWQIGNTLWETRYKAPYLMFPMKMVPRPVYCEFDIAQGAASLVRM
ncbi:MAG: hypothetical protein AB7O71_07630 [Hyphomicrobiaceae bacterium]